MTRSKNFTKNIRQLISEAVQSGGKINVENIRETFIRFMPAVPDKMKNKIYQYYFIEDAFKSFDSLQAVSYKAADMIDLFSQEYDEKADPLSKDDWIFIQGLTNKFAGDLELELLGYVMQLAVDRGIY
jgi:hypothetical protein